jgi:hypothetical protein
MCCCIGSQENKSKYQRSQPGKNEYDKRTCRGNEERRLFFHLPGKHFLTLLIVTIC